MAFPRSHSGLSLCHMPWLSKTSDDGLCHWLQCSMVLWTSIVEALYRLTIPEPSHHSSWTSFLGQPAPVVSGKWWPDLSKHQIITRAVPDTMRMPNIRSPFGCQVNARSLTLNSSRMALIHQRSSDVVVATILTSYSTVATRISYLQLCSSLARALLGPPTNCRVQTVGVVLSYLGLNL